MMEPEALEVIHRLYNFDYDSKVVQILAFGQREMNSLFETNKAVNARVFVRLALPPLTLSSSVITSYSIHYTKLYDWITRMALSTNQIDQY